jgi:putative oxidoreductase
MKELISKLLTTNAGWGITLVRVVTGIVFMMHGSQKLFGAFGGGGIDGTAGYMASLGLEPAILMAFLAGTGEFFGGLFLVLGLLTRFAAVATAMVAVVALLTVHINNGFFMSNNGFEFILILLVNSLALIVAGSGKFGLDKEIYNNIGK